MERQPILRGARAQHRSGVARISHRDSRDVCSGTAIAASWVVTAKHCVVRVDGDTASSLEADGFRVEIGRDDVPLHLRFVDEVRWIGDTGAEDAGFVDAVGDDVALLRLSEPLPSEIELVSVRKSYLPRLDDRVTLVGFGSDEIGAGASDIRREGTAVVRGFDPNTGVLQVEGVAACFGDSGGPVLLSTDDQLVGVLSRVISQDDAGFCESEVSFASSIANERVRAMLLEACSEGPCSERHEQDASVASPSYDDAAVDGSVASTTDAEIEPDGGPNAPDASPGRPAAESSCATVVPRSRRTIAPLITLLVLAALERRRSREPRRQADGLPGRSL